MVETFRALFPTDNGSICKLRYATAYHPQADVWWNCLIVHCCSSFEPTWTVTAKVVLPKSGPADHFWSPKIVRPDYICPPKVVLPCQKRSAIRSLSITMHAKCVQAFFFQLATYNVIIVSFFRGATYTCK